MNQSTEHRARICRSFMETRYRFSAWRAGTKPYLSYWPARLNRLANSIPRNRFLGSINVYWLLVLLHHPSPIPRHSSASTKITAIPLPSKSKYFFFLCDFAYIMGGGVLFFVFWDRIMLIMERHRWGGGGYWKGIGWGVVFCCKRRWDRKRQGLKKVLQF